MPPAPPVPGQPLRIETQHGDRTVVLGCETCEATVTLKTTDPLFATEVQAFFEHHAPCSSSIDLTD